MLTPDQDAPALRSRTLRQASWGAVFAGLVLALAVSLLIHLLGTAIGASTIDPETEANPVSGLLTGAGIWALIAGIVSLAIGGFVAGRLAPRHGLLHGLLVWAVSSLVTVYLIASLIGTAISGTLNMAGSGLQAVGSGVASVVPALGGQIREELQQANIDIDLSDLRSEVEQLLRQTGKPQLAPENLEQDAEQVQQQAQTSTQQVQQQPQAAGRELDQILDSIREKGQEALAAADREALVNLIQARGNMTQAEAEQMATQLEQQYRDAYVRFQELKAQAEQKARAVAEQAAERTAQASWALLITLLITAVVAALAGALGHRSQARHHRV